MAMLVTVVSTSRAADLPDPFLFADGHRVTSSADWNARRAELQELILQNEYGHVPPPPKKLSAALLLSHKLKPFDAPHRQFRLTCDCGNGREISFVIDLLAPAGDGPFPVILTGDWGWHKTPDEITRRILERGYMLAEFNRCELAPDNAEQTAELYAAYPGGDFGAVAVWAWGYHRCVDFLVTLPSVDKEKIAITGHSRGGKATLLAGATDPRIALTAPNASGCGGAGCYRFQGPSSERLENILQNFPFWFTPRLKQFIGHEDQLPFDQHCLKALCAPRALLTTEALEDLHANPQGTFQTHVAAREVYRFLGHPERIAIHFRHGTHEQNAEDFDALLDFGDVIFFSKPSPSDWNFSPFPDLKPAFFWTAPSPP